LRILESLFLLEFSFVGKFASIHWQIEPANCQLYVHVARQLAMAAELCP
jgi:hypothetical protein